MLQDVDDIVYLRIYLEGDFPAGFKRLRNATGEMLDEFRAYNKLIEYEFVNPSASDNPEERTAVYQQLIEKGLQPSDLQFSTKEGREQQIIFPGALISFKGKEAPLELLKSQLGVPPEEVLNNSVQGLEFNLATAIKNITTERKQRIAFITGHGELEDKWIVDVAQALSKYYAVEKISIDGQISSLTARDSISPGNIRIANRFDAIVIAKPNSAFPEKDKFIVDQYIMRGGNVLWLLDPVFASMDSLAESESTMGIGMELNLEDMLFNYGVRVNTDLVMDLMALPIPLVTGQVGNQPQRELIPWYFFPVVTPLEQHPIVKNLNAIKTEFVSSIDTIQKPGIDKTILLRTSQYSRILNTPAIISLTILEKQPDERMYTGPPQPIAVLLEGSFASNFKNRVPPEIVNSEEIGFIADGAPSRMIVVSDGDIIRNQLHYSQGYPLPLGYDQYTGETFGNKEFILNAMNYLTDDSGLIAIRSRELKIRLLDMAKVSNERLFWQLINILMPILLITVFGVIQFWLRKRKYARAF
jgi:ABC-2 type transport system permease protein